MTELAIQSLAAYEAPNWFFQDDGFYIHRNRAYLQGSAFSPGPPTSVTGTLFTGIPTGARPASTQTATVVLIVEDPATPGLTAPITTTLTITPAGAISIPDGLPYINASTVTPYTTLGAYNGTTPASMYPYGFEYTVVLAASWPVGPTLADSYTSESLAAYLDSDFENVDATIGVHDARVHLAGRVRATRNGASWICRDSLPSRYLEAVVGDGGEYAVVAAPATPHVGLQILGAGSLNVYIPDLPAPLDAPAFVVPSNINIGTSGGLDGESNIAGLKGHPLGPAGSWGANEPGGGRISTAFAPSTTTSLTSASPSTSLNIASQLAAFWPPPDWCALQLVVVTGTISGSSPPTSATVTSDVPCVVVEAVSSGHPSGDPVNGTALASMPVTLNLGATDPGIPPSVGVGHLSGWLAPTTYPAAGGYTVDPNNQGAAMLWNPAAIPEVFTYTLVGGSGYTISVTLTAWIIPYWNARQDWVMNGDVIDLTGGGWQATPGVIPTPTPTIITATAAQAGLRRRERILGSIAQMRRLAL